MKGQKFLDLLLVNGFKETTLKYDADRYSKSDLTNIYNESQKRTFEKNHFMITFDYKNIAINCATGMDGCAHRLSLEELSIEEVTMILLLSELKGTQRYIFKDYHSDFKSFYTKLQTEMQHSVPSGKKKRVLQLQSDAQKIYNNLLEQMD